MADSAEEDDENCSIVLSHMLEGRQGESLHLCPGENWLRLVVSTGGLDLLADTQDTSNFANAGIPTPSIVSLQEVGKVMEEWPTSDCYICIDVDGSIMTVKDMRGTLLDDEDDDNDQRFVVCLQTRRPDKRVDDANDDPTDLDDEDAYDELEELPRRQMRLLHNGDRLCTVAAAKQTTAKLQGEQEEGTLGLVLTYRRYKGEAGGSNVRYSSNTQVSQLTIMTASTVEPRTPQIALETQDDENSMLRKALPLLPQSAETDDSSPRPATQDDTQIIVADNEDNDFDDEDDDDYDIDDPTQVYPPMTQSPKRSDEEKHLDDANHQKKTIVEEVLIETNENEESTMTSLLVQETPTKDDAPQRTDLEEVEPASLLVEETPTKEDASQADEEDLKLNNLKEQLGNTKDSADGEEAVSNSIGQKSTYDIVEATGEELAATNDKPTTTEGASNDDKEQDGEKKLAATVNKKDEQANASKSKEQIGSDLDTQGTEENTRNIDMGVTAQPLADSKSESEKMSTADKEQIVVINDDDEETVLEEEEPVITASLATTMLDEPTQPLPESYTGGAIDLIVDRVPGAGGGKSAEKPIVERGKKIDRIVPESDPLAGAAATTTTTIGKDDRSDSTALTEIDEQAPTGRNVAVASIAAVSRKKSIVNDEDAIEDPEHAGRSGISPFSPMSRVASRGRAVQHQTDNLIAATSDNDKSSNHGMVNDGTKHTPETFSDGKGEVIATPSVTDRIISNDDKINATTASAPVSKSAFLDNNEAKDAASFVPTSKDAPESVSGSKEGTMASGLVATEQTMDIEASTQIVNTEDEEQQVQDIMSSRQSTRTTLSSSSKNQLPLVDASEECKASTPISTKEIEERTVEKAMPQHSSTRKRKASSLSLSKQVPLMEHQPGGIKAPTKPLAKKPEEQSTEKSVPSRQSAHKLNDKSSDAPPTKQASKPNDHLNDGKVSTLSLTKPAEEPSVQELPSSRGSRRKRKAPAIHPDNQSAMKNDPTEDLPVPKANTEPYEQSAEGVAPRQPSRKRKASLSPNDQVKSRSRRSSRSSPRPSEQEVSSKSQIDESQMSTNSIGSRKRQRKESEEVRVVVTGVVLTVKERAKIKAIGGVILDKVEDAASATHVIVTDGKESLRRTPKLMIALCKTSNVVSMKWLDDSAKKRTALAARDYLVLNDKDAECKYNFSMRETLRNGNQLRKEGKTLLDGSPVFVCKGVAGNKAPKEKELKLIIDAAGGRWVSSSSQLKKEDVSENVIIIASDPPSKGQLSNKDVAKAIKNGATESTTSWLFNSLLCQEMQNM